MELVASLCRMVRVNPPRQDVAGRDALIALFLNDLVHQYIIIPVTDAIYTRAADLCRAHPLRAYDAVQLAGALAIRDEALAVGVTLPAFVCADGAVLGIAGTEGLAAENPNAHP